MRSICATDNVVYSSRRAGLAWHGRYHRLVSEKMAEEWAEGDDSQYLKTAKEESK